jgi:adenylate cyclase
VECAVAIQEGMAARNAEVPAERRVVLRIGINLGDVIVEGDDIHGEGVNVAARLQELAEPGGVFVSGSIFEQVDGKVDPGFVDRGNQQIKNIGKLVRVYSANFSSPSSAQEQHPMLDMAGGRQVPVTGGCLCGEIRYRVTEPPLDTNFCHCRMCQKFTGAPVSVGSTYPDRAVRFTKGEPRYYKSSPFAERGFCANCGSSLTYRPLAPPVTPAWANWILIYTGSLDNPAANAPTWHLGVESQMPWLDIQHARKRVRCQDSPDLVEAWAAFNRPVP